MDKRKVSSERGSAAWKKWRKSLRKEVAKLAGPASREIEEEIRYLSRKKGITIRSQVDCLIAALAIEYDLKVLENDRDYSFIAQVFSLKIQEHDHRPTY